MKLTKEQECLLNIEGSTILKAGPGSGKTTSIAALVNKYLTDWKEEYKGVAIISFSNSGIKELKDKIKSDIVYPHYIGTIDGFIEKYIFYPYSRVLYFKNEIRPKIINDDNNDFFKILKRNSKYTSECYRNGCNYEKIKLNQNNEIEIPNRSCENKRTLPCKIYKNNGIKYSYTTHSDAVAISVQILKKYNEIAKALTKRFPIIIIDEAQDTSFIQMNLIEELEKNGDSKIYIVGDSDQAIYEWRDASPEVFISKYNDKKYTQLEFIENHRSSQKICDATYPFSTLSQKALAVGETREFEELPILLFYTDINDVYDFFDKICKANNINKCDKKILVRGRKDIEDTNYYSIENLWQNDLTENLMKATILKNKYRFNDARKLVEESIFCHIFKKDLTKIDNKYKYILNKYNCEEWDKMINKFLIDLPEWNIILEDWIIELNGKLNILIDTKDENYLKVKKRCLDDKHKDFRTKSIIYFDSEYNKNDIIETIHSSKGKTYDAVLLLLKSNGKLTLDQIDKAEVNTEVIRTAYVAMTRARKILIVAAPKKRKQNYNKFTKENWNIISL